MQVWRVVMSTVSMMRCHQWIKNAFVLAAPLFAKELTKPEQLVSTLVTFLAFCFMASAVYIMNDLKDLPRDRVHPEKRNRALAARRLTIPFALGVMVLLGVTSLGMTYALVSLATAGVLLAYLFANVLYSYVLKHLVIIDVGFIAVGFILRIMAGAVATNTAPSYWLLLCTLNVSLFLGFAKRRAEVMTLGHKKHEHREVLAHYSEGFLDQMISIVTTSTLICYILYTVDTRTVAYFGGHDLVLTIPFVMYGIFRYLFLTYHLREGGSPTKTILMDPLLLLNNIAWGILCILIVYLDWDWDRWFT